MLQAPLVSNLISDELRHQIFIADLYLMEYFIHFAQLSIEGSHLPADLNLFVNAKSPLILNTIL